jgi:hypothetical protein
MENDTTKELKTAIQLLASARQLVEINSNRVNDALQKFRDDHDDMFTLEAASKSMLAERDAEVRRLALEAFAADPTNKKPAEGVGIRVTTQKNYDICSAEALGWAYEHKAALSLDVPKFKAMVDIGGLVPKEIATVTTEEVVIATIAKDLPLADCEIASLLREKLENEAREEELRDRPESEEE